MTIEEILDCSADELEKMTDEELLKHFSTYLNVTRPELAPRQKRQMMMDTIIPVNEQTKLAAKQLSALGVDVSHLFSKRKKR